MARNDLPELTRKEFVAMNLLVGALKPLYGLQMVELSDGELKRGTIYVTLNRLEDKGYVTSETEPEQPGIAQPQRRRVFHACAMQQQTPTARGLRTRPRAARNRTTSRRGPVYMRLVGACDGRRWLYTPVRRTRRRPKSRRWS